MKAAKFVQGWGEGPEKAGERDWVLALARSPCSKQVTLEVIAKLLWLKKRGSWFPGGREPHFRVRAGAAASLPRGLGPDDGE